MAYVLGFFMADGYVFSSKRGANYFAIQIKDEDLLINIRSALGSENKITKRVHLKNKSVFYRLQIGSNEICEDLAKLGIKERKTYRLKLPVGIPKKYFGDFVRGYFDGDGNVWTGLVHKDRKSSKMTLQIGFTSCSELFLKGLQESLRSYGLGEGSFFTQKNYFRLKYSLKDSLILSKIMYNNNVNGLFLERKKNRFEKFFKNKDGPVV